ncbi:TonB-dependent receptor [Paraglaciecola sp.]|uniref:TonB-dependent receptor n=2 Tax=Paraglaciecola sp. TaxID=1920173 RepID=UPI003263994F
MKIKHNNFAVSLIALTVSVSLGAQENIDSGDSTEDNYEKIVVLGEKRGRTIQDTVSSVAIIDRQDIENSPIDNIFDVLKRTAGVSSGGGDLTFSIRGVNSEGQVSRGNPLATIYVDGAPLESESAGKGGPLSMWDVQQVEVFRGPQATTQGRNALAGAIVVNTVDPDFEWGGAAQAGVGNNGAYRLSTALGGVIVEDEFAFRVALDKNHTDGAVENVTLGLDDWALEDSELARVKLLWEPDAISDLTFKLTGSYAKSQFGTESANLYSDIEQTVEVAPFERLAFSNLRDMTTTTTKSTIFEVNYSDLIDGVDLVSITSYSDIEQLQLFDQDFSAAGATDGSSVETISDNLSQELRFTYDRDGDFTALLGMYYFTSDEEYQLINNLAFPIDASPFPESVRPLVPSSFNLSVLLDEKTEVENYAVFFEGEYVFNDSWRMTAGIRYDNEEQSLDGLNNPVIDDPDLPDFLYPILEPVVEAAIADSPINTETFDAWLPSVAVTHSFNDDVSVSLSAKRAYRSGGSDFNLARAISAAYDSEYAWTYELAYRSVWADGKVTANGNIYFTDWKNQQVSVQPEEPINRFDSQTVNAGQSELTGAELEVAVEVSDSLDMFASASISKTEFIEFVSGGVNYAGNEFRFAPSSQLIVGGNYKENGWLVNLDVSYTSSSYDNALNRAIVDELESRVLVNAKVGYEWDNYGVYFIGKNILDEEYVQERGTITALVGDAASYNVNLKVKF